MYLSTQSGQFVMGMIETRFVNRSLDLSPPETMWRIASARNLRISGKSETNLRIFVEETLFNEILRNATVNEIN